MALVNCRECGKQVSTEAVTCPHCGITFPAGEELTGAPPGRRWVVVAFRAAGHPTGKAKGFVAVGDTAIGVIALGRLAVGVVALGSLAFGGIAIGGMALGLVAIAGVALGGLCLGGVGIGIVALAGMAMGVVAYGGLAIGLFAQGGMAISKYSFTTAPEWLRSLAGCFRPFLPPAGAQPVWPPR